MALFNAGMLISETRKARGLTQAQLAEGICSRETISRIEQGTRKPDWFIFNNVLHRLGLDPKQYSNDIADEDELFLFNIFEEWSGMGKRFDQDAIKTSIEECEKDPRFAQGLGKYLLLKVKITLYSQGKYADAKKALDCAIQCLQVSRPDFAVDKIPEYFLSPDEVTTLLNMGVIYSNLSAEEGGGVEMGIKVLELTLDNMKKNFFSVVSHENYMLNFMSNLCFWLNNSEQFEKALVLCDEAIALAMKRVNITVYINFLGFKAQALANTGNMEEADELYKKAILFRYVMDGQGDWDFNDAKQIYETSFGKKLDLSVPW